jgi:hypothetical protein
LVGEAPYFAVWVIVIVVADDPETEAIKAAAAITRFFCLIPAILSSNRGG